MPSPALDYIFNESKEIGRVEGRVEEHEALSLKHIHNLMMSMSISAKEAMALLGISDEEQIKFATALK